LAGQNLVIQQNFQHILQLQENFDVEENLPFNQQNQPQPRGRSQGSKNQKKCWKNTAAPK
jgi:hypothetical protein